MVERKRESSSTSSEHIARGWRTVPHREDREFEGKLYTGSYQIVNKEQTVRERPFHPFRKLRRHVGTVPNILAQSDATSRQEVAKRFSPNADIAKKARS